ncbi:MAG TPA: hypothetical protein VFR17_01895, partial [Mycobacterium sp.]|nr:hypothetical protein [Mycobacterium sp.]
SNLNQQHQPKTDIKKHHTPNGNKKGMAKNNNKQKPPNTLLSSQTTRPSDTPTVRGANRALTEHTDDIPTEPHGLRGSGCTRRDAPGGDNVIKLT